MDRENKSQLMARDPKKAWETIKEMILSDDDLTIEDLDAELLECGVDPDDSVRRLFLLAQKLSRESTDTGRVSPHVSSILNQLAPKFYRAKAKAATDGLDAACAPERTNRQEKHEQTEGSKPKARAAVLSFHRNYKGETPKDQSIRKRNEKRLQERAEKLQSKKRGPKQ